MTTTQIVQLIATISCKILFDKQPRTYGYDKNLKQVEQNIL